MKFQITPAFEGDWRRLSEEERALFRRAVKDDFHPACERRRADRAAPWPRKLRVKAVEGAPGIWEMTWSFSGPDGRATFEWVDIEGEPGVRWRRIGGAEGRATAARRPIGSLPEPVELPPDGPSLSETLRQMRDEERW